MRILAATTAVSTIATGAWAAGLEARLGHSVVREGERVELQLRAPADGTVAAPDLSPLEKDFEILGTQQSQRISIVNGRSEASVDWLVTLIPLRKGEIEVPAIHAGAASSEPLHLRVTDAGPPPSRADAPDLFVESTVDQMSPYVQGEVRYTVKVYDGVGIRGGGLSEPRATNALVTAVGEGRTYEETVNGRRYQVHERDYTITPQHSGKVEIAPVILEARVADRNAGRRSPFDDFFGDDPFFGGGDPFASFFGRAGIGSSLFGQMMNPGREVRVRSNAIALDVQARPDGATEGWFLPAKRVELSESFAPKSAFRVGEAIKRTVTLRALGASAEQLPAFEIPAAPGVRQYDEGSRQGDTPSDDGTVSVREQTVALVPSKPGAVVLPPVEVTWWDVEGEVQRTARLPEHRIEVLPAVGEAAPLPAPAVAPAAPPAPAAQGTGVAVEPVSSHRPDPAPGAAMPTLWLVLGGLIALGLAGGGGYALASRRRPSSRTGAVVTAPKTLLAAVDEACRAGDPAATRDALLRWARATYGVAAPANPRALARKLGAPGFEAEAAKLDRSLYAPGAAPFDGASFWRELRTATRSRGSVTPRAAPPVLPELYPSRQTS